MTDDEKYLEHVLKEISEKNLALIIGYFDKGLPLNQVVSLLYSIAFSTYMMSLPSYIDIAKEISEDKETLTKFEMLFHFACEHLAGKYEDRLNKKDH